MPRRFPLALMLCSLFFAASVTAGRPDLLAAGHPVQAAAVDLHAGYTALAARELSVAEQAYQQAANAFHRANQPGDEATADEKLAAVFKQEVGLIKASKRAATPVTPGKTVKPPMAATSAPTTAAHPASLVPIA